MESPAAHQDSDGYLCRHPAERGRLGKSPQGSYFPHFFDLPAELRDEILMQIVHHPTGIDVSGDGCSVRPPDAGQDPRDNTDGRRRTRRRSGPSAEGQGQEQEQRAPPRAAVLPLSLLLANSQLAAEAEAVFYGTNVFHADLCLRKAGSAQSFSRRGLPGGGGGVGGRRRAAFFIPPRPGADPDLKGESDWSDSEDDEQARPQPPLRRRGAGDQQQHRRDDHDEHDGEHDGRHLHRGSRRGCRNLMGAPSRLKIRHLVITLRRLGGVIASDVVPALQELVLRGSLRRLEVRLVGPSASASGSATTASGGGGGGQILLPFQRLVRSEAGIESLRRNGAFLAVLRLLADPDLEAAVVRVREGPDHWAVWCPFHRLAGEQLMGGGGELDGGGRHGHEHGPSSHPYCRVRGDDDAGGWLDLDLRALIREFGGDGAQWWSI